MVNNLNIVVIKMTPHVSHDFHAQRVTRNDTIFFLFSNIHETKNPAHYSLELYAGPTNSPLKIISMFLPC